MHPAALAHPETLYAPGHWQAPYCQPPKLLQIQRVPIARLTDKFGRGYWGVADEYGAPMLDAGTFRAWFPKAPAAGRFAFLAAPHPSGIGARQIAEVTSTQAVRASGLPGWNGSGYYGLSMAGWLWLREQWRLGRRWIGLEVAR